MVRRSIADGILAAQTRRLPSKLIPRPTRRELAAVELFCRDRGWVDAD